jgi:TRAP-type C4-dicarboxylate transport system permease small subunit
VYNTVRLFGQILGRFSMKHFSAFIDRLSTWFNTVAVCVLVFMMFLVVTDVILRILGHPIIGTYEIVMILAAPLVAFAMPQTSIEKQHITVDFFVEFVESHSKKTWDIMFVVGKTFSMVLFLILTWFLVEKGIRIYVKGDFTDARHIPLFPIAFMLALCSFIESLVLFTQIIRRFQEQGEARGQK